MSNEPNTYVEKLQYILDCVRENQSQRHYGIDYGPGMMDEEAIAAILELNKQTIGEDEEEMYTAGNHRQAKSWRRAWRNELRSELRHTMGGE